MKITNSQNRIKELLNESGDNMSEMARKSGISKSTLSRFINGLRTPNQESVDRIAKAYHVSPAWLMGYEVEINGKVTNEIISLYESLSDKDKDFALEFMRHLAERSKNDG